MFWKWDKIPSTLYFTVTSVKVHKNFGDEFELSWARGDNSGTSQRLMPDKQGVLHFEEQFQCPCTIYRSKKDGSIRPKNVKFVLKRFTSKTEHKIYGKLTVDVGNYFNTTEQKTVEMEMESGRSHAPVITITFSFQPIEITPDSQQPTNEQDMSFIGDTPERQVNLNEWDATDIDPELQPEKDSPLSAFQKPSEKKKRKHKHKKHTEGEKAEVAVEEEKKEKESEEKKAEPQAENDAEKTTASSNETPEAPVQKKEGEEEDKKEKKDDNSSNDESEDIAVVVIPASQLGEEEEEKKEGEQEQKQTVNEEEETKHEPTEEELAELKKKEEEKKKAQQEEAEFEAAFKKDHMADLESLSEAELKQKKLSIIEEALSRTWPEYSRVACIDRLQKVKVPSAVLPLCAVIFYCDVLEDYDSYELFINSLPNAPFSDRCNSYERFLTRFLLVLNVHKSNLQLSEQFVKDTINLLNESFKTFLTPFLVPFEVILNRFSTARFNDMMLIHDFDQVIQQSRTQLQNQFPPALARAASRALLQLVDARAVDKLLANPARFTLTNGATWSSFCTGLEATKVTLPVTKQFSQCLMMASQIVRDQALGKEICSELTDKTILYIMTHLKPDEMMPLPVDATPFAQAKGLDINTEPEHYQPSNFIDINALSDGIAYESWKKCLEDDVIIELYPFITKYIEKA